MTPPHIDAILYDFGGVLIEIDFDRIFARWAELANVPFERVKSRFSHGEAYQRHERDEIGLAEYYESLRRDLAIDLTDEQFTDGWQRVFGPEFAEVTALTHRLAPRVPQFVLSNTNRTHYEYWSSRYAGALAPMRRVFASCDLGVRKPEPAAFERVARETGIALERFLFLDDTQSNLDGARALGVQTALVRSPADVLRALAPWGG